MSFGCRVVEDLSEFSTPLTPVRTAILLIGGDKAGNDRFYEEYVPVADDLYDKYLAELRQEGLTQ